MEPGIDLHRIVMEKKPIEILIKIDKVALLINNEAMDLPEIMYIRDIQIKQVYLNLIKEYLDAVDILEPDIEARNYRNMFLVFDCFDLRKEVDERYRKHQIPFIQMTEDTNDCVITHSEGEETFEDIHPEYVSSVPSDVEQRSFAFTGTTCCGEVTKETKVCKKVSTKRKVAVTLKTKNNIPLGGLFGC